jgi:hypothetical protein
MDRWEIFAQQEEDSSGSKYKKSPGAVNTWGLGYETTINDGRVAARVLIWIRGCCGLVGVWRCGGVDAGCRIAGRVDASGYGLGGFASEARQIGHEGSDLEGHLFAFRDVADGLAL